MVRSPQTADVVRFGPFELDLRTAWLTRQGQPERLGLQPSRFLTLIVQRRGELVTREELRSQLWAAETFVDFDHGLNNAVNRVREVLRDSASSPRYIQTVPRRGYRFIARVEAVGPAPPLHATAIANVTAPEAGEILVPSQVPATVDPASIQPRILETPPAAPSRRWPILAAAAIMAVVIVLPFAAHKVAPSPIRSLAVLPMQNLSGRPGEDYFVDGMTDALITELARTPNLRVVSRTSVMQAKGSKKTLQQIASELNVDAVVEGSVVRSGNRVRITAQLIDTRNDRHLWSQSFEDSLGDVLSLQDKVVAEIASQTKAALAPSSNTGPPPTHIDPAAYDAYLRGMYFLHQRNAPKSVAYFQQAVALDPSYAAAYAGLAEAFAGDRVLSDKQPADTESQALAAAKRAIALDPNSGEAYAALGFVEIIYRRDWAAAGRNLEKGLALNPNNSIAELQYAIYLDAVGRPEDAVAAMRRGLKLDPLSFTINRHLGSVLYFARRYPEALLYLHRADEMEPHNFRLVENWRTRIDAMLGRFDEAEQADLLVLGGWLPDAKLEPLRIAYQQGGWKRYQRAKIELLTQNTQLACAAFEIAESYLRLGNHDQAVSWLNRGMDTSCFWANSLAVDPVLDPLRTDPRFATLQRHPPPPVAGALGQH